MTAPEKPKAKTKADIEQELADAHAIIEALQTEVAQKTALLAGISINVNTATPTVYEAWSTAMAEVQAVSKDSRNAQQGFNFRGIDAVMNTVGPVLRRHGLIVVPTVVSEASERYETAPRGQATRGTPMVNRLVEIKFTVYGPQGDSFSGSAFGEAADSGDKAMAKAHSVASRTFLLQSLTIPTDEPDPDASSHERAAADQRQTQAPPPQQSSNSPADHERDLLRALANEKRWDLARVAQLFTEKVSVQGARPADLRTAAANDIRAFRTNLEAGTIQV